MVSSRCRRRGAGVAIIKNQIERRGLDTLSTSDGCETDDGNRASQREVLRPQILLQKARQYRWDARKATIHLQNLRKHPRKTAVSQHEVEQAAHNSIDRSSLRRFGQTLKIGMKMEIRPRVQSRSDLNCHPKGRQSESSKSLKKQAG